MAWTKINFTCGHTDRVQLYGKNSERDRIVASKESGVCSDCWRAALMGTEKQVAWARIIRIMALPTIEQIVGRAGDNEPLIKFCKRILATTDARYWIEKRDQLTDPTRLGLYIDGRLKAEADKKAGAAALAAK